MSKPRIGQLLSQLVPLSQHDVEEILQEQKGTRRRFGEIAMSLGLCEAEHIWKAWSGQTGEELERVELGHVGIDTQAVGYMTRETVLRFSAIPVRSFTDLLVVAIADPSQKDGLQALLAPLHCDIKFVLADASEIEWAIETYYPASAA